MNKAAASSASSSQETATKLQTLLKEIPRNPKADAARLDDLRRLLSTLVQRGDLSFSTKAARDDDESATEKWNRWLQKQHRRVISQLVERIRLGHRNAVRTLWGLIAASPQLTQNGRHAHVHCDFLFEWFHALVAMPVDVTNDKPMKHLLEAELSQRDVQYYVLRCIARLAQDMFQQQKMKGKKDKDEDGEDKEKKTSPQEQIDRLLHILMMIPFPTSQEALQNPTNKYLFPPPKKANEGKSGPYEDQDDESEEEKDSDDDSEVDDESDEEDGPPTKKRRQTGPKQTNTKHFAFQDIKCQLTALSKAWLAVLRLPLSTAALKIALPFLSTHVLPKISNPLQFADLYMQAYSGASGSDDHSQHAKSVIPLLALDGLFYLMTQHQLEYPQFYAQLYALCQPRIFYVKFRTRFFKLLEKCLLRNEMLPAHLVAAFVKRLLQGALQAPAPSILFVLALISNLLRQHEECACLIHREGDELDDPYDPNTDDPVKSNALGSSLWELEALERHYLHSVATLAESIGREDPKSPMLQLDEFASITYNSLIEQERKRKGKQPRSKTYDKNATPRTPVTFVKPTGLFTKDDIFAGVLHWPKGSEDPRDKLFKSVVRKNAPADPRDSVGPRMD